MNAESAMPPEWVGKAVTVTVAGAPQDTHYEGRLEAVGSDGFLLHTHTGSEPGTNRFFPWQAIRQVRLGRP